MESSPPLSTREKQEDSTALSGIALQHLGLSLGVIETIYRRAIEPELFYEARIWHKSSSRRYFEKKLAQIQQSLLLRIAKSYGTVSHEALCTITTISLISLAQMTSFGQTKKLRIYETIPIQRDITSPYHPATSFFQHVYPSPLPISSLCLLVFTDGSKKK